MKIIDMKNKVKIVLEYSKKTEWDWDKLDGDIFNMKIFLKNGSIIYNHEVGYISVNVKEVRK